MNEERQGNIANTMLAAVPDFLKHLPTYRGYPVPYFVPKDENGIYQLKYASQEKMNSCLAYHKCCVCFKPLTKNDYWFENRAKMDIDNTQWQQMKKIINEYL